MEGLVSYRKQHIDGHLMAVVDEGKQLDEAATQAQKRQRDQQRAEAAREGRALPQTDEPKAEEHTIKDFVIGGSQTLSSDYDISLVGPGEAWAVGAFNRRFGAQWGKESGSVFDTNVYGAGAYLRPKDPAVRGEGYDEANTLQTAEGRQAYERTQDVLSLVKIAKFIGSYAEWQALRDGIVAPLQGEQKAAAMQNFQQAWQLYQTTAAAIAERQQALMADQLSSGAAPAAGGAQQDDELALAASNRLYEEKLVVVRKIERERDEFLASQRSGAASAMAVDGGAEARLDQYNVELRRALGEALLFANEPYYSQGATAHVVGKLQGENASTPEQERLKLSAAEGLQSINEQFGDFLKVVGEHSGEAFAVALIESSKYLYRLLDGVKVSGDAMAKAGCSWPVPDVAGLQASTATLLAIRKGEGAWKDTPLAGKHAAALSASSFGSAGALTAGVRSIVTAANIAVRSPQPTAAPAAGR